MEYTTLIWNIVEYCNTGCQYDMLIVCEESYCELQLGKIEYFVIENGKAYSIEFE